MGLDGQETEDPVAAILERISQPIGDSIQVNGQSFPVQTGVPPAVGTPARSAFQPGRLKQLADMIKSERRLESALFTAQQYAIWKLLAENPELQETASSLFGGEDEGSTIGPATARALVETGFSGGQQSTLNEEDR